MSSSLIAVIGTLVGILLGNFLARKNEVRKWLRDNRLETYTELLTACEIVSFEADHAYGIEDEYLYLQDKQT